MGADLLASGVVHRSMVEALRELGSSRPLARLPHQKSSCAVAKDSFQCMGGIDLLEEGAFCLASPKRLSLA